MSGFCILSTNLRANKLGRANMARQENFLSYSPRRTPKKALKNSHACRA